MRLLRVRRFSEFNSHHLMGMFDYFVPNPPIECQFCGSPTIGWQGKHWGGSGLFVWEQGHISPVDQRVDDDCRLPPERLATRRLEAALIPIYGGGCEACGKLLDYHVKADARSGTWLHTVFDPPALKSVEITPEILLCSGCGFPVDVRPPQQFGHCPDCKQLVARPQASDF